MGLHQCRTGLFLDGRHVLRRLVTGHFEEQLVGHRVAVGVEAGGGQADKHIGRLDSRAGHHLVAVHRTHDKARQVVLPVRTKARHLRCFASDQDATAGLAGIGHAGHHALRHLRDQLAAGHVVQKKQGRGALDSDVIDAVIHQVRAYVAVHPQLESHLQLGSHPIDGTHQDGIFPPLQVQPEERPEAAHFSLYIAITGLLRQVRNAFLDVIGSEEVYPCISVGCGFWLGFVRHGAAFQGWIYRAARLAGNINFSSILIRKYLIPCIYRLPGRKNRGKMESRLDNFSGSSYSEMESWLYVTSTILNRVTELRIAHEWTQEQLAQAAGVSRQSINSIERNRYVPSLELALKFAQIFTCSTDEIFQLENQP